MPWIIRNAAGEICGRFTNKPGDGNKMPDGTPEAPEWIEDDPARPEFDAAKVQEADSFVAAQAAMVAEPRTVEQKLAAIGLTIEDLKAELAK